MLEEEPTYNEVNTNTVQPTIRASNLLWIVIRYQTIPFHKELNGSTHHGFIQLLDTLFKHAHYMMANIH